jgi:type I restriction enzyme S subunit
MEFDYPLPQDWKWIPLGQLADPNVRAIVSGPFGSNISSKFFTNEGIPVIRGNNLTTGAQKFVDAGFVFVTPDKAKELGNVDAVADDIIFTAAGSLGQVGIIPFKTRYPLYIISNKQMRVRLNRDLIEPLFAFQWLSSTAMVEHIKRQNTGSSVPLINLSIVRGLPVPLPPLAEQKAIAAVLGALDDKIELNRRMNATLEAMARALFQSWFVDFDPVRAKLDGRKPDGLDKPTAALFPSTFQNSPLGPIPKGWIATTLGEACQAGGGDIQTGPFGTQLHASDYVPEGIPSIMPSDLRDNRIDPTSISRIREKDAERLGVYRVEAGDVVYSRRGDVERRSLIRKAENGWLCGTGCLRVRFGGHGLNSHFGASYLGTLESRAWVVRHAVGATMPNLNTSILGALPMVVPPPELQSLFGGIVGPWDERGTVAPRESRSLAALRDALLPKLLSGELQVASTEQIEEKSA